mmetsp:Transcript_27269/g.72430  ORF Transcript_27269/g.72430 Transcript_27269/m.72430 type:complete len:355 (+) Transcript_27269:210-1274(+)
MALPWLATPSRSLRAAQRTTTLRSSRRVPTAAWAKRLAARRRPHRGLRAALVTPRLRPQSPPASAATSSRLSYHHPLRRSARSKRRVMSLRFKKAHPQASQHRKFHRGVQASTTKGIAALVCGIGNRKAATGARNVAIAIYVLRARSRAARRRNWPQSAARALDLRSPWGFPEALGRGRRSPRHQHPNRQRCRRHSSHSQSKLSKRSMLWQVRRRKATASPAGMLLTCRHPRAYALHRLQREAQRRHRWQHQQTCSSNRSSKRSSSKRSSKRSSKHSSKHSSKRSNSSNSSNSSRHRYPCPHRPHILRHKGLLPLQPRLAALRIRSVPLPSQPAVCLSSPVRTMMSWYKRSRKR